MVPILSVPVLTLLLVSGPAQASGPGREATRAPAAAPGPGIEAGPAAPPDQARREESISERIRLSLKLVERDAGEPANWVRLVQTMEQAGPEARSGPALEVISRLERLAPANQGNAFYHYGLGTAFRLRNEFPAARAALKKSISLGAGFWEVYEELVNSYLVEKDIDENARFLKARLAEDPANAFLHQAIGVVHYYRSEYQEAFACLERARAMFQSAGDRKAEGRCRLNLSDVFTYFNDYPGALREAQAGLRLAREAGDKLLEARCLERSAFVWIDLGADAEAFEACRQALSLSGKLASPKLEAVCVRTRGVIFLERGDLAKGEDCLAQALAFYRRTEDLRSQEICLYWLTLLHLDQADYSKAKACADEALGISRRIGFKTGEAFHLTTIGDIYLSFGDYDRALEFNKKALSISERYIGKWSREECLNTIGFVYLEVGDYGKALASFQDALRYIEQIGHGREEARCLYNIGFAQFKLGNLAAASSCFLRSLASAEKAGKKVVLAFNCNRLGDLYRRQGLWEKAKQAYARAETVGRETGQPNVIWEAYAGLGALHGARDDYASAVACYKKAVEVIEDLRVQLLLRQYSSGFFKSKVPIYEALVNLLFDGYLSDPSAERLEECLYYVEKAKARSFLDDLQKARVDFSSLPRVKADELGLISKRISRLSAELSDASKGGTDRAALRDRLEQAETDYQLFIERERAENSQYSKAVYSEPCRVAEIRSRLLNAETGILEYFVGEENLYIFVVTARGMSAHRLSAEESRGAVSLARNYVRLLSSKDITAADVAPAGRKLYRALIGDCGEAAAAGLKNLIIIPDRSLYDLPFEALVPGRAPAAGMDRVHFLMEDFGITYAPSASTLVSLLGRESRPEPGGDLLSIGDPSIDSGKPEGRSGRGDDILFDYYLDNRFVLRPLEFASREMESISRLIVPARRRIVSGSEATEGKVKSLPLSGYKVLHFATHSLLDEKVASRSALVLTPDPLSPEDGFLQAGEIYSLDLNADLVVLSACQTAGGKMEKGEGIQGLARAFFCAGSKSVVASLWNVNDRSTSRFMKDFYAYLTAGKTKQEALRLTKVKMSRSAEWRPCHWAAFVLVGEGGSGVRLHRASFWSRVPHL